MEGAKTIIERIKKVLFEDSPTPAPVAPVAAEAKTYKTKDGNEISIDKLEAGGMATASGAPCAPGNYELEDGTVIEVGEGGVIASVKQPEAQSQVPGAIPATPATPAPVVPTAMTIEMDTPEKMRAAYERFATGTPEERLANLELVAKALIEYSFGWQIKEAQEKADREAAIKIYTDSLATAQAKTEAQGGALKSMLALMEQFAGASISTTPEPPKNKFSFSKVDNQNKAKTGFQNALAKIQQEYNN